MQEQTSLNEDRLREGQRKGQQDDKRRCLPRNSPRSAPCSPGVRPAGHRGGVRSAAAQKLKEKFWSKVTEFAGSMEKKATLKMVSELALGRFLESPFRGFVDSISDEMDELVSSMGQDPARRPEDRDSEINFRRLRAWAVLVQDADTQFLGGMAATGVALGVRGEIPFVEAVYTRKDKKSPDEQAVGWCEEAKDADHRSNYASAQERMEKVRAHVESDIRKGWMEGTSGLWR